MFRLPVILLTLAGLLSACGVTPQTSAFNSDTVTVRTTSVGPRVGARAVAKTEADRVCGERGRIAEYASTTASSEKNREEHLFLCLDPKEA